VVGYLKRGSDSRPFQFLPSSRKRSSRHKDAWEKKEEEHAHPEEVPLLGKVETQTLLHKIEELEKINKELR